MVAGNIATSRLVQVTVRIDGSETHVIVPNGGSFELDDYETKHFCLDGKHSSSDVPSST